MISLQAKDILVLTSDTGENRLYEVVGFGYDLYGNITVKLRNQETGHKSWFFILENILVHDRPDDIGETDGEEANQG